MFFVLSFYFYKIREQEGGTNPVQQGGLAPVEGEDKGEMG
jgi:hypothetical protein